MEVILKEDVDHLGQRGDVVKVADGFGRNYLLPRKLAMQATAANKAVIDQMKESAVRRSAKEKGRGRAPSFRQVRRAGTLEFDPQGGRERAPLRFGHLVRHRAGARSAGLRRPIAARFSWTSRSSRSASFTGAGASLHREVSCAHARLMVKGDAPGSLKLRLFGRQRAVRFI